MPNKTIYVSEKDIPVFEKAKKIAGEALSSVISHALQEYVARNQAKDRGMQEISIKVGVKKSERELHFVGIQVGEKWTGLSHDNKWRLEATIYLTQKGKWAVYLVTTQNTTFRYPNPWDKLKEGDYFMEAKRADFFVAEKPEEFIGKLPQILIMAIKDIAKNHEKPVVVS